MELPPAFYIREGDRLIATELTRGPWSRGLQHGGAPAGLLVRAIEDRMALSDVPLQLARMTVELWRPVPIGPLSVTAEVVRSGKKVQVVDATLLGEQGPLGRASAILIRRSSTEAAVSEAADARSRAAGYRAPSGIDDPAIGPAPAANAPAPPLPPPDACPPFRFPFFAPIVGYHEGVETRLVRGTFGAGAMAIWFRMRAPLVLGEAPTPLQRALLAADSGNGVSVALDLARWTFVNPDLTVALHRPPEGEWVCLDAETTPGPAGSGLVTAGLHDLRGPIGRSLQTLVVEPREAP